MYKHSVKIPTHTHTQRTRLHISPLSHSHTRTRTLSYTRTHSFIQKTASYLLPALRAVWFPFILPRPTTATAHVSALYIFSWRAPCTLFVVFRTCGLPLTVPFLACPYHFFTLCLCFTQCPVLFFSHFCLCSVPRSLLAKFPWWPFRRLPPIDPVWFRFTKWERSEWMRLCCFIVLKCFVRVFPVV